MKESYVDRLERILVSLRSNPHNVAESATRKNAALFIQEQAAMIVRLENENRELLAEPGVAH